MNLFAQMQSMSHYYNKAIVLRAYCMDTEYTNLNAAHSVKNCRKNRPHRKKKSRFRSPMIIFLNRDFDLLRIIAAILTDVISHRGESNRCRG